MRSLRAFSGLVVAFAATAALAAADSYKLVDGWGMLPAGQTWGEVTGVDIDSKGTIIAVRRSEPPILEFDSTGKLLKSWGEKMFAWPHGFRIDKDGNLWITDGRTVEGRGQQVFKMSRDGRVLLTLGTKGQAGEGPNLFNGPCDVAIGNNGDIFIADGHSGQSPTVKPDYISRIVTIVTACFYALIYCRLTGRMGWILGQELEDQQGDDEEDIPDQTAELDGPAQHATTSADATFGDA